MMITEGHGGAMKFIRRYDVMLILLAAVAAAALLVLFRGGAGTTAVVEREGERVAVLPLNEARVLEVETARGVLTVAVADGRAWIASSPCETGSCVQSGAISQAGQAVICLPCRVALRVEGARADGYDGITG